MPRAVKNMVENFTTKHERAPAIRMKRKFCLHLPSSLYKEGKKLFKFAIPITLTSILMSAMGIVSVIFAGALGENELAAVGLALSIFNVTGLSIMQGLLSTSITVFSQIFGSGNKYQMGVELQKALYIASVCCLSCWGIFLTIEPVLLAIGINPLIAQMAAEYLLYLMPAILFASVANVFEKYIQSQTKFMAPTVIGAFCNLVNALLHYLLLFHTEMGIKGSAISQSVSFMCSAFLMVAYLYFSKLYKNTWRGFSRDMWHDWESWLKLGIPGLVMIALKWWFFEICLIVVGTVGVKELAAQTLLINLNQIIYSLLSVGLGVACSIIVGQSLGSGRATVPPVTIFAGLALTTIGMAVVSILIVAIRWQVPKMFTLDPDVIAIAAECMPWMAFFLIFEGLVGVMGGAMRGAGLQPIGALTIFVCLYLLSAPLGLSLLLWTEFKLIGLWIGLAAGLFLISVVYLIILLRTNWHQQVKLAAARAKLSGKYSNSKRDLMQATMDGGEIEIEDATGLNKTPSVDSCLVEQSLEASKARMSTRYIILSRGCFTFTMFILFVFGLIFKLVFPVSQVFGSYCLRSNGTFLRVPTNITRASELAVFSTNGNCTFFTP